MFGWLGKKGRKLTDQKPAEEPAPTTRQPLDFTRQIKEVVDLYLLSNAKPSLLYAKAAGYRSDVIDYNNIRFFLDCLRVSELDFKESDASAARSWFEGELESAIKSDYWEHFFFGGAGGNRGKAGYAEVEVLRAAVRGQAIKSLPYVIDGDIGGYALSKAIEYKRSDLERIFAELEERKGVLKPLFGRALASGRNKYGEIDYGKYFEEINEFFDYFFPEGKLKFYFSVRPLVETLNYVEGWLAAGLYDFASVPEDAIDFEYWCAAKLEEQGWIATISKVTGDQGVDIEARRGSFVVAIQCKRYTQPIGNKAVQEVYAGAKNINADAAAVIGTGGFTKSAISLSRATAVELFDVAEMQSFSERFGFLAEGATSKIDVAPIVLEFKSLPERMLALMFRGVLTNFDLGKLSVDVEFRDRFYKSVDDRGFGVVLFESTELASLLIFSSLMFSASFVLTPENLDALRKHDYPVLEELGKVRLNGEVFIHELIGRETIALVRQVFLGYVALLPVPIDLEQHFLFDEVFD